MSFFSDIALGAIKGILDPIASIFNKKEDVSLEKFKVNGQVDLNLVQAHRELGIAKINLLRDRWLIALQCFFALPVGIFFWKCIIWDKVLAWGVTDPLGGDIQLWAGMIMAFLFGVNILDKWSRKT